MAWLGLGLPRLELTECLSATQLADHTDYHTLLARYHELGTQSAFAAVPPICREAT